MFLHFVRRKIAKKGKNAALAFILAMPKSKPCKTHGLAMDWLNRVGLFAFGFNHATTTIKAVGADVVAQMHFTC